MTGPAVYSPAAVLESGWSFGQPTVSGDYEWWSEQHSLDVSRTTVYLGYNGNPGNWGRDVWFRRLPVVPPGIVCANGRAFLNGEWLIEPNGV